MDDKITLYKEVLALEPASRVFFSLARLLFEADRFDECASVLTRGVEFHPDHVEARMLLVEALQKLGKRKELMNHVHALNDKLSAYPGFLNAWSEMLSQEMNDKDTALAISFLAARFLGNEVSWADILERGLRGSPFTSAPGDAHRSAPSRSSSPAAVQAPRRNVQPAPAGNVRGYDSISLRTRTMADLLAEQGEYAGALDIYQELYEATSPGPGKDELALIMQGVRSRMNNDQSGTGDGSSRSGTENDPSRKPASTQPSGEKQLLMQYLERLASRLEARASGEGSSS